MGASIYIPSKGRASTCLTAQILKRDGIKFNLVIEPQDLKDYLEHYSKDEIVVMKKDNGGIAYARNFCKQTSISRGEKEHWQIDDNIKNFRIREGNKNVVADSKDVLYPAEEYFHKYKNVSMVCLRHMMYAWSQKTEVSYNQCMYTAFMMKNNVPCLFRDKTVEDADFTLQVLMTGECTVIFNKLLMEKVTTEVMKGGNTEIEYSGDRRLIRCLGLCKQWPGGFKVIYKNGKPKVHPRRVWSRFKRRPVLK